MSYIEGTHFLYTVQPGDTLYNIAAWYGSAYQLIEQTNAIYPPVTDPGLIFPGQLLVVSVAGMAPGVRVFRVVGPGDTLYEIGQRLSAPYDMIADINGIRDPSVLFVGQTPWVPAAIYEVREDDTLFGLSRRWGIPVDAILRANENRPGLSPDVLYPGYRLIVPLPSSRNIVVIRPLPGTRVTSGQRLEGFARSFEGVVQYRLLDDRGGTVISEKSLNTTAVAPRFGYFSTELRFERRPQSESGELWVYNRSPRDGQIVDLVQVKVHF